MKKIILSACLCFAACNMLSAQIVSHTTKNVKEPAKNVMELLQGRIAGLNITHNPWMMNGKTQFAVNGKIVGRGNMFINPADIAAIENIEDKNILSKKYDIYGRDVIEITMKPDAKLFSLNQLLRAYNIPAKDWQLPVFVDGDTINNRKKFIASADYIQDVKLDSAGSLLMESSILIKSKKYPIVTVLKVPARDTFSLKNKTIISAKDIKNQPADNVMKLLHGKVCVISRQSLFQQYVKR